MCDEQSVTMTQNEDINIGTFEAWGPKELVDQILRGSCTDMYKSLY